MAFDKDKHFDARRRQALRFRHGHDAVADADGLGAAVRPKPEPGTVNPVAALQVIENGFRLFLAQSLREVSVKLVVGKAGDDYILRRVLLLVQPARDFVQRFLAVSRQHGTARFEELRFWEPLAIARTVGPNQLFMSIDHVAAHYG